MARRPAGPAAGLGRPLVTIALRFRRRLKVAALGTLNDTMNEWRVEIQGTGRGGAIVYTEFGRVAPFRWELGGKDVVFIISGAPPQEWDKDLPWAANRRAEVMSRIASEMIRTSAPGCTFELGDGDTTAIIKKR
jgi:hypothetical protein